MPQADSCLAAIALGSNLDDPAAQIRRALMELQKIPATRLVKSSSLYRSVAVGADGQPVEQPDFCNAAALLDTRLSARDLLEQLQSIERAHGRERGQRYSERTLDLDLLVFGDLVLDEAGLTLPHPRMAERNFVLCPLNEIAPELEIPDLGPVCGLTARLDTKGLEPWQN